MKFFSLLMVLFVVGCEQSQNNLTVSLAVKTNENSPLPEAKIMLDGAEVGSTDASGKLTFSRNLQVGTRHKIEVRKDSTTHYYAPYFEGFQVVDSKQQKLDVQAVLYSVPKPTPQLDMVEEDAGQTKDSNPSAEIEQQPLNVAADQGSKAGSEETAEVNIKNASEVAVAGVQQGQVDAGESPVKSKDENDEIAKPILAKVTTTPSDSKQTNYPKKTEQVDGKLLYTIYVVSGNAAVEDANVYVGFINSGDLKLGCTTNSRGRCVMRFPKTANKSATFVVKKDGFKTKTVSRKISDKGSLKVYLERGKTLDVFATTKKYNFTKGLEGVDVYINGKKYGTTDRFGSFQYVYDGLADDLISVTLKTKSHLPETYETDYVASGDMTLVKYFAPKNPSPVRLSLIPVQPAGKVDFETLKPASAKLNRMISRAVRNKVFSLPSFEAFPATQFRKTVKETGRKINTLLNDGWIDTDLKGEVDGVMLPTLVMNGDEYQLEISVTDSHGKTVAAAKTELKNLTDEQNVESAIKEISQKIARVYPFEGAVLAKNPKDILLNLGTLFGAKMSKGDIVEVFGTISDRTGFKKTYEKIGKLKLEKIMDSSSQASVVEISPRAAISRGDVVVLRPRREPVSKQNGIKVVDETGKPVAKANIYLNKKWVGSSNDIGTLHLKPGLQGYLQVIKNGYRDYAAEYKTKSSMDQVEIVREAAYLRIESEPSSVSVKIDGRIVGKTPLMAPVPAPTGFVKIELVGPPIYKDFSAVVELEDGTLDLTGTNKIKLEKDIMRAAENLVVSGKISAAVEKLTAVPESHSDYLVSRHRAGELLLSELNEPAKAAGEFFKVTENDEVKNFINKKFIGAHVNEAVAVYMTGENLAKTDKNAAIAHYQKAVEIFDRVRPFLRFVPKEQNVQTVHSVEYHKALCLHRLWKYGKDPAVLSSAIKSWRGYLEGSAKGPEVNEEVQPMIENARVFYKQARASLAAYKNKGN